jgi:EPS-associated MarR family transcriptional regulator
MVFDDGLRRSLFRLLQTDPRMSQRSLAEALGISLGKVNYCLRALIAKGWVETKRFRHDGKRWGYEYALTSEGLEAKARSTVRFLQRKTAEYEALHEEIKQLRQEVKDYLP